MNLAQNLLEVCRKKKMSLSTLSKKSGVKQPTLHGWTTGRSVQNLEDLRKVCEVLEVGLHSLLFDRPDPFECVEKNFNELFKGEVRITINKIEKIK
ncbi:MAG: helix-turn-helix domain-containing protein [Bacteriovoracia bacterium]